MDMPMMGAMGPSNMTSALGQDVLKKVMKTVSEHVSAQAGEAIQQGVPFGHILDQLVKMAPGGMSASGNQPPGGGQPGGGPPSGGTSSSSSSKPSPTSLGMQGYAPSAGPAGPTQMPQPGTFSPSTNNQPGMPGQAGAGAQIMRLLLGSNLGPGLFPNQSDILQRQALYGQTPQGQVAQKVSEAKQVPLSQEQKSQQDIQKAQLQAQAYMAQLTTAKDNLTNLNQEEERATANFNALLNSRSWLSKSTGLGSSQKLISEFKTKLEEISKKREAAQNDLISLYGQHPNLKNQSDQVSSGALIGKTIGKYKVLSVK